MSADVKPDLDARVRQCHAVAVTALQAICEKHHTTMAGPFGTDVVTLVASKEIAVWTSMEHLDRMLAEAKQDQADAILLSTTARASMDIALKARRYWLWQHCPLCWAWGWTLRLFGFRLKTEEIDLVLERIEEREQ